MPGYKGHITGGLLFSAGTIGLLVWLGWFRPDPLLGPALVFVSVVAALFPDVDTDSKGQGLYYGLMVAVDLALITQKHYKWAAILGLLAMLPAIGHHRGWTHTWWAMLVVPLPIVLVPFYFLGVSWNQTLPFYLAAVGGYFSHLALDRKFF